MALDEHRLFVFFHDDGFDLEQARGALRKAGLIVTQEADGLAAFYEDDGPLLFVDLVCGALQEVIDDMTTLAQVRTALQKATQGVVFTTWDRKLVVPESR
jgi:hypothetical protein